MISFEKLAPILDIRAMNPDAEFWTAFADGLASPVSLYSTPIYIPAIRGVTVPSSFAQVGAYLIHASVSDGEPSSDESSEHPNQLIGSPLLRPPQFHSSIQASRSNYRCRELFSMRIGVVRIRRRTQWNGTMQCFLAPSIESLQWLSSCRPRK